MNLDVGCGHNLNTLETRNWFKIRNSIAIDIQPGLADVQADAIHLPFNDNCFETVTASEILEHLDNPTQAIKEWYRVLKPKGKLFVTVPNAHYIVKIARAMLRRRIIVHPEHKHCWFWELLIQLLENNGFHVLKTSFFTRYVYPSLLAKSAHKLRRICPSLFNLNIMVECVKT